MSPPDDRRAVRLHQEAADDIVATLCAAFHDYPVMRYILKDAGDDYEARLAALVGYFTHIRFARDYPVLGVVDGGELVAAATVNPPVAIEAPEKMAMLMASLRTAIGEAAINRFDSFASACNPLEPEEPHYYLGMIGVPPEHRRKGHSRLLLDHLHAMSAADPASAGVVLTTETRENLPLYEHFGYRVLGEGRTEELITWTLFRPDETRRGQP